MDKMLSLKGKLEMAKQTVQLQKLNKKQAQIQAEQSTLIYKDEDDSSSDGQDESSDEEEIKQIPVAGSKRQKLGSDDEESEEQIEGSEGELKMLDDSVEESDGEDSQEEKERIEKLASSEGSDGMMDVDEGSEDDSEQIIK